MTRAVGTTLIEGGAYSYIHVLSVRFLFKLINLNLIKKETPRAPPINVLAMALPITIDNQSSKICLSMLELKRKCIFGFL